MDRTEIYETEQISNYQDIIEQELEHDNDEKVSGFNIHGEKILDSFNLLKEIQSILQNSTYLTPQQKLMYCESQRYFMKLYLREINKEIKG
ncbi:MAG: hypothetical protein ACTSRH_00040 [Promethearchaeota archaeon]